MSLLIGLSTITHAADTAWDALDNSLSSLQSWGTRNYTYSVRERGSNKTTIVGTVSLSTELRNDSVLLIDKFDITYRGEQLLIEIIHTCGKDNFLSPSQIEIKAEGGIDEVASFVATVAKGQATIRMQDGRQSVRELPEGTITTAAMMRLVTTVPQIPNRTYSYKYSLESEEMNLKKDYRLEVLPPETIQSGDNQVRCSKFNLTGGGISPVYYWVTKDGVLQRLMLDNRKVIELKGTP